jgi:hypothetical protein
MHRRRALRPAGPQNFPERLGSGRRRPVQRADQPPPQPVQHISHAAGEFARDDDGDGFCEVHVNTLEGLWSLLRSWLRPHRGISQERLPLYLGFFEFVHNVRRRGKALLGSLIELLVAPRNPG